MKLVVQRVSHSSVEIGGKIHGSIDQGFLVLVGITADDTKDIIDKMIEKLIHLRVFEDQEGKMNLSLLDIRGSILSVSQFTLYADCKKGRRPGFTQAARPEIASPLYDYFNQCLVAQQIRVETGIFGTDMKVTLTNDGPITIILDSKEIIK